MAKQLTDPKQFPSITLKYIDVPCCPVCGALPVQIATKSEYSSRTWDAEEEVRYACGFKITFSNGTRHTSNECGHLKDIMNEMVRMGVTTEEMLTSGSSFQHIIARVRSEEAQREQKKEEVRRKTFEKEARKRAEENRHRKGFFGFEGDD